MNADQQKLFNELTQLQQRLATNVLAGMSQRAAYVQAGGKGSSETVIDSSASEILRNPQVKAFMDSMKVQAVSDAIMTREEAMRILTAMSRGKLTDIVKFRTVNIGNDMETGDPLHQTAWVLNEELQHTDPDKLIIISELEVGKNGPKIKTHSKTAAIAQLAKMQGWEAASKHEISGANGGPILTKDVSDLSDADLAAYLAADVTAKADD